MSDWGSIYSALGAAILAGGFTLAAVWLTSKQHEKRDRIRENLEVQAVCQAICDEVVTLWNAFSNGPGRHIDQIPHGGGLNYYLSVKDSYFKIYEANAGVVGKISDKVLRRQIVITYTEASGLIDAINMNNFLLKLKDDWYYLYIQTGSDVQGRIYNERQNLLNQYAPSISKSYNTMKTEVGKLIKLFESKGFTVQN